MKKLLLSLLAASASWVSASTVSLSSGGSTSPSPTVFNNANSAVVANGSFVRVGMLTTAGNTDTFVEFGTSQIRNAGLGATARPGKLTGEVINNNLETDDAQFNAKDVYIWVYNAPTAGAATEWGVFKVVGQVFPTDDPGGFADTVTILGTNITEYVPLTTKPAGWVEGRTDFSAAANDNAGNGRLILGAVIPEPSSMGLLALAGLALARRRR
ncbi:MAG TPA: PEP-CTERM sorting domain-containing protein [Verrucomicrobiales bacterium]|jgi:hypothetical protein|nr:PEP-CTERM sorting domain-containing protein [Verrucomicrobiales bacterium]